MALDKVDMDVPGGQSRRSSVRAVAASRPCCGWSPTQQPFAGSITLGGRDATRRASRSFAGLRLQSPTLLPWRSVRQNIELPLDVVAEDRQALARTTKELIDLVRPHRFRGCAAQHASGGMQQRVAIARALC